MFIRGPHRKWYAGMPEIPEPIKTGSASARANGFPAEMEICRYLIERGYTARCAVEK